MNDVRAPLGGGKRAATSVRPSNVPREALTSAPDDNCNDLDARAEAALEAAVAATVPTLRAHLRSELAARLPSLRAGAPPRRARTGLRPGDDVAVDDTTRAKARAILDRHGIPRGRR